jgi:LPS-assembly protein
MTATCLAVLSNRMYRICVFVLLALAVAAGTARAQTAAPSGCSFKWSAASQETIGINTNHYLLFRNVQVDCNDIQLFADQAEVFSDTDRLLASGNVLFVSNTNRISAERLEFNTRTKTGTFFTASGIASIENRGIDKSLFGTQEPDAYFWGETIEKLGPKTYRVTRGGFTTCVQPTPRWELVSGSATITLEKHAVMTNTLLMVKGVPMFYLPVMYYPINKEDRATGFLIPVYGSSTLRGQSISVPFFWAINRSQDATLEYDFFSKTGQAVGGEYRFVQAPGSQGSLRTQYIAEHDAEYPNSDGTIRTVPGQSSYSITGSMVEKLPDGWRATGNANYFSSLVAQQRYQQNVFAATNTTRSFNAGISGMIGKVNLTGSIDRSEYFSGAGSASNLYGSLPRILANVAQSPIAHLPLYWSVQSEFVTLQRVDKSAGVENDHGLSRIDFMPTLRFPYTKWQFLTFNNTLSWRETYWTESLQNGVQVNDPIGRRYFDMSTQITGPVFDRIFGESERKLKHVIEPTVTIQRVTDFSEFDNIVPLESADFVRPNVTKITYGVNNRLYAKRKVAREVFSVRLSQSYYTDELSARVDAAYQSGFNPNLPPSHLSPVNVQGHVSPDAHLDATVSADYDTQVHALRNVAANGSWHGGWVQTTAGWSQQRYIPNLPGFNNPDAATNFVNAATSVRKPGNAFGGTYSFNYDLKRQQFLQQRYVLYYNSQCCGVGVEYQSFSYGTVLAGLTGIPQDHRFNITFTLAGVGTFSNLLGAFGGQQTR